MPRGRGRRPGRTAPGRGGGDGTQQGAGAAGRVERDTGRARRLGQLGHQAGEFGRGERVLARIGIEMPPEQELERLACAQLRGEFRGASEEGGGGEELGAGGGLDCGGGGCGGARGGGEVRGGRCVNGRRRVNDESGVRGRGRVHRVGSVHGSRGRCRVGRGVHSLLRVRGVPGGMGVRRVHSRRGAPLWPPVNSASAHRTEARHDHLLQRTGQHRGHPLVRTGAHVQPDGGAFMDEQQGAAGVHQGGDRTLGVTDELLPDPFAQRDFGEFPLLAQPGLDLGEGEGRAGLGAADRLGEVRVTAAPVADGGTADTGEPGDSGGGHLCRIVLHSPHSPRRTGRAASAPPMRSVLIASALRLPPVCDAEHTDAGKIYPFTAVYTQHLVNRVDSVHSLCSH